MTHSATGSMTSAQIRVVRRTTPASIDRAKPRQGFVNACLAPEGPVVPAVTPVTTHRIAGPMRMPQPRSP
ncbi:MAG: hypothetical protein Kow0022_08160 [Phycisphaerales bacterium]